MIPVPGHWSQLRVGMYIADKTGVVWRIDHQKVDHFGIQNAAGERVILPPPADGNPDHPVTIMVSTDEEALAALADKLGAEVLGEYHHESGAVRCPTPPYENVDWWRAHLEIFHGVAAEDGFEKTHAKHDPIIPHAHC